MEWEYFYGGDRHCGDCNKWNKHTLRPATTEFSHINTRILDHPVFDV